MTKLLIFSDIHADYRALGEVMDREADYYFAAGDLVNFARGFERVGPILQKRADKMYVLPGNHESAQDIAELCRQYRLHDFHEKTMVIGDYQIAGLGYSNRTPFDTPGECTEEELAQKLERFADLKPLVLICHCPPKDTPLDGVAEGAHFGSSAVKQFIERQQPEYFFCGHIHEAAGVETTIGKTRCFNVGPRGYMLEL